MNKIAIAVVAGAWMMAGTAWAADGVLLVQRTTTSSGPSTNQVQIAKDKMRAEVTAPGGGRQVVIFDAAKQVIDIVNVERKTYSEMTKADLDNLANQAQQMRSQMQSAMANLPPAQRAQMEAMMASRGLSMSGPSPAAAKVEYRKTGTDRVGKWTCDKYDVLRDGQKSFEVCTVSPSALGLAASDVDVMRQLGQLFKQIASQASAMFDIGAVSDPGFIGVPVRSVMTVAGQPVTTELTDISHQSFPDTLFAVPDGFQKTDMMRGRGRGRE